MLEVKILPAARERLLDIWSYTSEEWDDEQADLYVEGLIKDLNRISEDKMIWRAVKEKRIDGVYFVQYEHHYVFFREFTDFIGVISILHEQMDLPNRLKEDIKFQEGR